MSKEIKEKKKKKRMTLQEQEAWDELYQYVRKNVMGYDENQSLSTTMALRLKGLLTNKFIENYSIEDTANYSYEVILNTFKYCMPEINNNFKDEMHKFNYALKIVEPKINDVYIKMKNNKKAEEKVETFDMSHTENYTAKFRPKESSKTKANKFDDLW